MLSLPSNTADWPLIVEAAGGVIVAICTAALVGVTQKLVTATNRLARVGEDTWKSNVVPVIWSVVPNEQVNRSEQAILGVRNACSVDVINVNIWIYLATYTEQNGQFYSDTVNRQVFLKEKIERMPANTNADEINIWDAARAALEYAGGLEKERSPMSLIAGLRVVVHYSHSITGHGYILFGKYIVRDSHHGSLTIFEAEPPKSQPMSSQA